MRTAAAQRMLITLPYVLAVDESRGDNAIRQIGEPSLQLDGVLVGFTRGRLRGSLFRPNNEGEEVLVIPKGKQAPDDHLRVIEANVSPTGEALDLSAGVWVRHPLLVRPGGERNHEQRIRDVLESWSGAFSYVLEAPDRGIVGLRNPQIGAVHAVHAHWSVSDTPATIVMPTGTGKTEVMISTLVSASCSKVLVVVPTDALRTQLADKFLSLGILRTPGCSVLDAKAKYPLVCTLFHIPRSVEDVDDTFGRSQVIVTTSSIVGQCEQSVQERMARHCSHLFIDEAHHVEAPTWSAFKQMFNGRRILQFTATPFREDGKKLDGDIIFKYPLRKAQLEGYFKPIRFQSVVEFGRKRSDRAIAQKAIAQLRADIDKGHILMARVESVARAKEVFELYRGHEAFKPVQLHTGIKSIRQREAARRQIISGESRVVVCVDMLGEGFDLPELKIAAFHDIRKTLAVTLQLVGRFTRARPDLGEATFIANTGDVDVQHELRKLYSRDPDWNLLLPQLNDTMVGEQVSLQEFLSGFTEFADEIPLRTVRPATSAVVYRTTCDMWTPENFRAGIPGLKACEQVHEAINHAENTLVVVTARRVPLEWTDVESLFSWEWELYVVVWSPDQGLLFINSSSNAGEYRALAEAVAGETATLIRGQDVFRTFAGVNRLRLQQVGLSEQLGRNVRYTGRMGADVESGLSDIQLRRALKSVLSGNGYEEGKAVTVGASRKGRIWSHRRDHVNHLVAWCKNVGAKLLDETIDPDEVLKGTLVAEAISARPAKMPIGVDWPEEVYTAPEAQWTILLGDQEYQLAEVSLEIVDPDIDGPLRFAIASENQRAVLELELLDNSNPDYRFLVRGDTGVRVRRGTRAEAQTVDDYFYNAPPVIWFADGSFLEGNLYVPLKSARPPFDPAKIQAWDWAGVDITKESQGEQKYPDSIQARVIRELRTQAYQMIVDDDAKGEAADIVAIRVVGDAAAPSRIEVEFYHCKYSHGATPGQRVTDLYEVCGQAQKSIHWMASPEKETDLFSHLLRREALRQETGGSSRYEVGDGDQLQIIRDISHLCPVSLKIFIVQPGLSKANATTDQLQLLSVTENYLMETFQLSFGVIASE